MVHEARDAEAETCPPRLPRWVPRRTGSRVAWSLAAGAATYALATQQGAPLALALSGAWDAFAGVLLGLAWAIIATCDASHTRARARLEDPGRTIVWVVVLAAATVALFVSGYTLRRDMAGGDATLRLLLGLGAVALSWLVAQTSWTLRYAHLYYREDAEGGLEFPGTRAPDDLDFAYFAFTLGMTFQTSDVTIHDASIRRTVTCHCLAAFIFNIGVLAFTINVLGG